MLRLGFFEVVVGYWHGIWSWALSGWEGDDGFRTLECVNLTGFHMFALLV